MDTPLDAAARPATTKDEKTVVITVETRICRREHKFPEGDPQRDCHLGLQQLDARVCGFCTWTDSIGVKKVAALTGEHSVRLVDFMKQMKDESAEKTDAA
jgi:hypothetical protein